MAGATTQPNIATIPLLFLFDSSVILMLLIFLLFKLVSFTTRIIRKAFNYFRQSWSVNNDPIVCEKPVTPITYRNNILCKEVLFPESARSPSPTESGFYAPEVNELNAVKSQRATIIIAVDATPTRAGGLLLLPGQERVYFCSVEWKELFDFGRNPDSDKFELVNAMLALKTFEKYVRHFRMANEDLILRGDNTIFGSLNPATAYDNRENAKWRKIFQEFHSELQGFPFLGARATVTKKQDMYLKLADRLSRGDYGNVKSLPEIVVNGQPITSPLAENKHINISEEVLEMIPFTMELQNRLLLGPLFRDAIPRLVANNETVWMFTRASPHRFGGILVLPKQEQIYFYSVDWTEHSDFGGNSEEMELVNAFLALSVFGILMKPYRKCYDEDALVLLCPGGNFSGRPDTTFSRNARWKRLFSRVHYMFLKYEPIFGNWDWVDSPIKHRYKASGMKIANLLCKKDCSTSSRCPRSEYLPNDDFHSSILFYPGYAETNISIWFPSAIRLLFDLIKKCTNGRLVIEG